MLALPFWMRLMQCLKVYSVTGEQKNLWNALKYSTAFPLVYAGYLRRHRPSLRHDRLFALAAIVQSSYCFFWDVQMDWGLLRRDARAPFGWSMREPLLITEEVGVLVPAPSTFRCLRWALFAASTARRRDVLPRVGRDRAGPYGPAQWEVVVKIGQYSSVPLKARAGDLRHLSLSDGSSDLEMLEWAAGDEP